jgi:drug/metabolite transporter (DMT)-like permease
MVGAVTLFAGVDALSKYLTARNAVATIVWWRYVVQMLVMLALFVPTRGWSIVRTNAPGLQVVRGMTLVAASLVFVTGVSMMPLAEASSIAFMAPLFLAVLAGPFLGEKVRRSTWVALGVGFLGTVLIVRPGGALFTVIALLPLANAVINACYAILTRKLAGRDSSLTTNFYPAFVGTLVIPFIMPGAIAPAANMTDGALMFALGVLAAGGHLMFIRALHHAPATTVAPFSYTQLIGTTLLGFLLFGQFPDGLALVGMGLIAASGLALALRQLRKSWGRPD